MTHTVLLYYKYATVKNPQKFRDEQFLLCQKLRLTGRILIAEEGINGTLEGTTANVNKYCKVLASKRGFAKTHFKKSVGDGKTFPKLSVKVREDIVSNAIAHWGVDPRKKTGKHLSPENLRAWFESGKKFKIVDMRNDYEHKSGHFEGSVLAPVENFRDIPKVLPKLASLKKEKILTVCTGGVRCEKASALLLKKGFKDVYQLDGGIVSYMEKYPNKDFLGKLYVFDQRVVMGFKTDSAEHKVIGRCDRCKEPSEHYINCGNPVCHVHFICCEDCVKENSCCKKCAKKHVSHTTK